MVVSESDLEHLAYLQWLKDSELTINQLNDLFELGLIGD